MTEINNNQSENATSTAVPKKKVSVIGIILMVLGGMFAFFILICIVFAIFGDDIDEENGMYSSSSTSHSSSTDKKETSNYFEKELGLSEEEAVKNLATEAIKSRLTKYETPVYNLNILEKDEYYNYIVGAETKNNLTVWWRVLIKIDTKSGLYNSYVLTSGMDDEDGNRIAKDDCINEFKTRSKYGWGKENNIEP
ncbi:hypothetical protein [Ruminococcus flavefaciens]|uniref:Uncharacterized protein n=1 Tax=Ruminococcus flavefaciens 007c TaxID=1341157 RepID=W7UZ59_RUMFL|nr:hypothetical protein [Ruminococcus flavefaciens]EWM54005.1 hypothetical protein RF007C_03580 [Ruminococcus flavefaciens 007c]